MVGGYSSGIERRLGMCCRMMDLWGEGGDAGCVVLYGDATRVSLGFMVRSDNGIGISTASLHSIAVIYLMWM